MLFYRELEANLWRSGGVEHHHDTPPYLVKPSPTSGHSSPSDDVDLVITGTQRRADD
jgi:hypothetical protein